MKKLKDVIYFLILMFLILLLVVFSTDAKSGAVEGLNICKNIIVPSLLPLMVIFAFVQNSPLSLLITKIFGKATRFIFRLPECSAAAIIFGAIGGFPTGAILTENLLSQKEISENDAKRILCFNVNGGIPFIINCVGMLIYANYKIGIILFLSTTFSALVIGFVSSFFYPKIKYDFGIASPLYYDTALDKSISGVVNSLCKICTYIVVFSAFCRVLEIPSNLMPIFEISSGACNEFRKTDPSLAAFFLGFGGFCIHLQLFATIKKFQMKYIEFLSFRCVHALLSLSVSKTLFYFFPQVLPVAFIGELRGFEFTSTNNALSILLIIGCFIFILDLHSKRAITQQ